MVIEAMLSTSGRATFEGPGGGVDPTLVVMISLILRNEYSNGRQRLKGTHVNIGFPRQCNVLHVTLRVNPPSSSTVSPDERAPSPHKKP
jgi:hypothetical protein